MSDIRQPDKIRIETPAGHVGIGDDGRGGLYVGCVTVGYTTPATNLSRGELVHPKHAGLSLTLERARELRDWLIEFLADEKEGGK